MNQYPPPDEYEAQKRRLRAAQILQVTIVLVLLALIWMFGRSSG